MQLPHKSAHKQGREKLEKPSLVLVTHGSFVDFFYAAAVTKKDKPHFITNRMYFYKKAWVNLLKTQDVYPKAYLRPTLKRLKTVLE